MNGIDEHGFWLDDTLENHHFDEPLAEALLSFFKKEEAISIADFGCGHGKYTKLFDTEIKTDGFDGNPNTEALTNGLCKVLDLSLTFDSKKKYDWIMSLEVGEHIPKEFEGSFLWNLHNNNTQGIVLSWAIPGQGGNGHFNEQSNEYIKDKFKALGYENDLEAEKFLREKATHWWFKNTIMVFKRK